MTDKKTGIHEPTLTIPWWMDCRPWDVFLPIGCETSEIRIRNLTVVGCGKYGVTINKEHLPKDADNE